MINIKILPVGQMRSNCYIVWGEANDSLIIDPGDDADLIINSVQDNDLKPQAIIATHGHFDHVMAVLELKLAFNIPFYFNSKDDFLLDRLDQTALHFLGIDPGPPPDYEVELKDEAEISISDLKFKVLETPGHTPGSVALYFKNDNTIFVGDVIFANGSLGRTDFKYCDKQQLLKSVKKILDLPGETNVYPGHDEHTTVSGLQQILL